MKAIILQASARNDGNSSALAKQLSQVSSWPMIDINEYNISDFDYLHHNRSDDFLPLMKQLIANYDCFVFVTPVYWYSMSGKLKTFLDRFTDLITIEKDTGRKLRSKQMAVVTTSQGGNLDEQFWLPFTETANYLGITYLGNLHTIVGTDYEEELRNFVKEIAANATSIHK